MFVERSLQIEALFGAVPSSGSRTSEHVKFPKQQYKVTARSLQNLMMLKTSWKFRSWVGALVRTSLEASVGEGARRD